MVTVTGPWTHYGIGSFLRRNTIPLRLACRTPAGPWMLSLWFCYRDGDFVCATSRSADVVEFVEADPEVAFEISTNDPPYRGVRGRGTVEVTPDPDKEVLSSLIERYLGGTDSPLAEDLLSSDREEVTLRIDPDRLHSWDFTDRMRGIGGE